MNTNFLNNSHLKKLLPEIQTAWRSVQTASQLSSIFCIKTHTGEDPRQLFRQACDKAEAWLIMYLDAAHRIEPCPQDTNHMVMLLAAESMFQLYCQVKPD